MPSRWPSCIGLGNGAGAGVLGLAIVVGEPGIGKTRLVAQFAAECDSLGAVVLAGATEEDAPEPYLPIVEALAAAPRRPDDAPVVGLVDGAAARARLHERLAGSLERAAAGRPLLLVLDDLQWADPDTLAFLRRLARRGLAVPALVLATARLGELGPASSLGRGLPAIERDASVTRIEIGALTLSDSAALIASRGDQRSPERADIEALVDRTGGNPFFLEALVDAGLTRPGAVLPMESPSSWRRDCRRSAPRWPTHSSQPRSWARIRPPLPAENRADADRRGAGSPRPSG